MGYSEQSLKQQFMDVLLAKSSATLRSTTTRHRRTNNSNNKGGSSHHLPRPHGASSPPQEEGVSGSNKEEEGPGCRFVRRYVQLTRGSSPRSSGGSRAKWEDRVVSRDGTVRTVVFKINAVRVGA